MLDGGKEMAMHRDIEQDYRRHLSNMKVADRNIPAEYVLAHVLMAGKAEQIQEVVDKMEVDDFCDKGVQSIFMTVKEEAEKGNILSGQEQFMNITSSHSDRFTKSNFVMNKDNKRYANLTDFYFAEESPNETEMRSSIKVVKDKRLLRDMIYKLYSTADVCTHEENGIEKAYALLGEMVFSYETEKTKEEDISKFAFSEGMTKLLYEYNDPEKRSKKTINMPWRKFQRVIGGWGLEELNIISARSGQGKSALSLNVAIEAGVTQNIPTLYINSELSNEQMIERYLSYTCYLDSRKIREGRYYDETAEMKVNERVYDAVRIAADKYYKSSLLFKRIPDLQLSNIEKAIRTDCMERQTKLVIVDYLGRMDITKFAGVKDLQEWQIMRLAANRLKTLAQKYHVCIIMVCQLTDEGTLQGSKAIKNEADMWLSINRLKTNEDKYAGKRLADIEPYNTFINIEKARNVNDTSAIKVRYEGAMMRFCDTAKKIQEMVLENKKYGKYANDLLSDSEKDVLPTVINAEKNEWWNK